MKRIPLKLLSFEFHLIFIGFSLSRFESFSSFSTQFSLLTLRPTKKKWRNVWKIGRKRKNLFTYFLFYDSGSKKEKFSKFPRYTREYERNLGIPEILSKIKYSSEYFAGILRIEIACPAKYSVILKYISFPISWEKSGKIKENQNLHNGQQNADHCDQSQVLQLRRNHCSVENHNSIDPLQWKEL